MENNLLNNIKSYFNDDILNSLALRLGVDKDLVKKGVDVSIPSLLLGIQSHNKDGLSSILTSAKHLFSGFDSKNILGRYFSDDDLGQRAHFESDNLVSAIFGDKLNTIVQAVGQFAGIKTDAVRGLFGASIPVVISTITAKGAHWDALKIAQRLNLERSTFAAALPAGMGLGAFGNAFAKADVATELPGPSATNANASERITNPNVPPVVHTEETVAETKKGAGMWWLLIPVLILVIWLLLGKSCGNEGTTMPEEVPPVNVMPE